MNTILVHYVPVAIDKPLLVQLLQHSSALALTGSRCWQLLHMHVYTLHMQSTLC
jgi:hypothetical protein